MKYLCLIYIEKEKLDDAPAGDCLAYASSLRDMGKCTAFEALRASEPAITVRPRDGIVSATDGPFPETKELLAGFYVLDVDTFEEALRLVEGIPPLPVGRVELRPVLER